MKKSEESVFKEPRKFESLILSLNVRPVFESYLGPGIAKRWKESLAETVRFTLLMSS